MSEEKKKKYYYYGGKEKKASEIAKGSEEAIVPYSLKKFQQDFDNVMERFQREFENFWELPWKHGRDWRQHFQMMPQETIQPSLDVEDRGNDFRIALDLPGFKKEEVDLEVSEDVVTVRAERSRSEEEKKKNYIRKERTAYTFYRRVPLPEKVRSDEAKASLNNGLLEITLPKKEPKETKKIRIA